MKKVIFVCTGNTCRSPMAEGLLKMLAKEAGMEIAVISRGVFATGQQANDNAVSVMAERKVDIHKHISKQFKVDEVDDETLVLTMTRQHKAYILEDNQELNERVFSLGEYVQVSEDIGDPYGGNLQVYRRCADSIENMLIKFIKIVS